jgi:guanylate kinase
VGKGSVVKELLTRDPSLYFSVSAKTRAPREDEVDGREYRFMSEAEFDRLIEDDAFLEWASMFGHRSGTLREPVDRARAEGRDVLLEIDVQGAELIRQRVPDAVLVFIAPPSREELERRLRERGTEDPRELEERLRVAFEDELPQQSWFDHVVENDDLERAAEEVLAIIEAHRTKESTS